ncbi:uncharacterized protein LTHEOB_2004 [Neofusicoccum parvum]|nr:uncharacterized protein LTHEOB_2004 [Neofusicoccum parvum]
MDSFTNTLAAFTRLLPHSVSDQASKMFVKRLLKAFFDRVEELIYRILWVALSGLFQTFWLLVFQRVVRRVTTPAASSASSVASSSSGSSTDDVADQTSQMLSSLLAPG